MQKVVDYKLITSPSPGGLNKAVCDAMSQDWVPSGSIIPHSDQLIQAMVKFEDEFSILEPADDLALPIS